MKNRTLTLMAACLVGLSAFAQWSEPEVPTTASTFTAGHLYRLRNAEPASSGEYGYMAGGVAWYSWNTSTVLLFDIDAQDPITYSIEMAYDEDGNELGYTFYNVDWESQSQLGPLTYVSELGNEGLGLMHMDGYTWYTAIYFNITETTTTNVYQISIVSSDADYGEYADKCWGYIPDSDYPTAVYAFLDPNGEGNECTWEFVDMTDYTARMALYEALEETLAYPDIDEDVIAEASALLADASATVEQLEAEVLVVEAAIREAATKGASEDNPNDVTILIENPTLDTGIDGWDCTFVSGVSATNVGLNNWNPQTNTTTTYINHEGEEVNPFINNYIEAWEGSASYGAEGVASIGDAELSQTMESLPAGKYKLSCDAIAVQQYDASSNPVKGVQLFAKGGIKDNYITIANPSMNDQAPYHYELIFFSTGGDVTLGLRTVSTNANWIAADNFEMLYYGSDYDIYLESLKLILDQFQAEYPYMDEIIANADVKAAFSSAIAAAESAVEAASSTDEEYDALELAIRDAADALSTSVAEYVTVAEYIDYINSVCNQADENGWDELGDELADYRDDLEAGYEDGNLTSEQIAEMEDIVSTMIADYVGENCKAGDDVSILIRNRDFDTDFSGWTVEGATPAWGGMSQDANSVEGGVDQYSLGSGNAEVFQAVFDISQTIKNMPNGLYTLSCQAFARDDGGDGVQGELYAILGGEEQKQTIKSLYAEGSPEQLYASSDASYYFNDVETTLDDGTTAWVPNGMDGANIYFSLGYYYNYFNILVTERGDLTIGVRDTGTTDWVLFDTFRLVYQGNDAAVYADYIQELIEQAIAIDDNVIVDEADQMLVNAITEGEDALDNNDADACIAAIQSLEEAIAYAEESITLVEDLNYFYDYTVEIRMPEVEITTDSSFDELVEEIDAALNGDGFETNAQVEGYKTSLLTGFTTYVMAPYLDGTIEATEEDPADITPVIMTSESTDNEGEGSTYGWDIASGTTVGLGYGCAEIYNQEVGAGMSQVLYNLAAGYYRLGVQAFYRPGNGFSTNLPDSMDVAADDTIHYADIYAGEKATRVRSILSDAEAYDAIYNNGGQGLTVPNSMEEANNAFEYELYGNTLQFQVAEDGTDVTIGIVKTQYISGDWLIWDNWTLHYLGTTEPTEDATTAIEGIEEGASTVATSAIYSANGVRQSRLTKGINIVKTTMADGTVNVTKVLVK